MSTGDFSGAFLLRRDDRRIAHNREERLQLDTNRCLVTIVVHPDSPEERGEQLSLYGVRGANVQRLGALEEIEVGQYRVGARPQFLIGRAELVANPVFPDLNLLQPLP
ncbi:hypothetical protein PlfCFBP13513_17125 [Plantibacter flavus]|uniref:hypothetical protein n=1 Tax=Plantibacter flavus TaxID=150123 RepID=UPI0010C21AC1|nr:hypothetical protein [Plantibacter flavus]TKJ95545.1 hypothetical protein PlfCFBP13513_17125 [Plantibacter flavus]